jgi:TRAP-type C4-dicarboxylate transport system permease small subunit
MELDYSGVDAVFPRLHRIMRKIDLAGLWLAAASVAILGVIVISSITMRALTGRDIPDGNVVVGDLVVAVVALAWGVVTGTRGNIFVEVFTNWTTGRARAALDAFASLVGLAMIVPLAWASYVMLAQSVRLGTYYDGVLQVPQWPSRLLFFYAFLIMSLRLVFLLVTDIVVAARSRTPAESA